MARNGCVALQRPQFAGKGGIKAAIQGLDDEHGIARRRCRLDRLIDSAHNLGTVWLREDAHGSSRDPLVLSDHRGFLHLFVGEK
mgnify:CR=1 FL=1